MGSYLAHGPKIYPKAHKNPRAFSCISGPIYLEFSIQCPCGVGLHQQGHPEFLKPADPETLLFLNKKSQLAAFLASSKSKESLPKNLKEVLQIFQQEEEDGSYQIVRTKKEDHESSKDNDPFY